MKTKTTRAAWLVLFGTGLMSFTSSAANLLTNGDFESEPNWGGGVSHDGGYTALMGSQIPGWTIESGHTVTIHISPGPYLVISNAYSANTDGEGINGHNANLYQDFNSAVGGRYVLAFDWQSWGYSATPTTSSLKVSVTDVATSAVMFAGLYNYDGSGPHLVHHVAVSFVGTGNPLRLRIEESPESGYNDNTFVIDNFSVTEGLPQLGITLTAPFQTTLFWPTNATDYVLETVSALPTTSWSPITNVPVIVTTNFNLSLPATNGQQFFRLHHP